MAEADALLTLAEIALGLAGFTGVIVVFGRDPKAPWHPLDSFRVVRMLSSSLGALFFSLLPEGVGATGLSAASTWRLCSLLPIGYLLVSGRNSAREFRSLHPEYRAQLNPRFLPFLGALFALVSLALAANVIGIWWVPGYPAYYFGVLYMLGFAAFQFVRIVFVRPGTGPPQ